MIFCFCHFFLHFFFLYSFMIPSFFLTTSFYFSQYLILVLFLVFCFLIFVNFCLTIYIPVVLLFHSFLLSLMAFLYPSQYLIFLLILMPHFVDFLVIYFPLLHCYSFLVFSLIPAQKLTRVHVSKLSPFVCLSSGESTTVSDCLGF